MWIMYFVLTREELDFHVLEFYREMLKHRNNRPFHQLHELHKLYKYLKYPTRWKDRNDAIGKNLYTKNN